MADSGGPKKINYSFGMEKMKQKDEEARLERMNTKQKRGTPTVRIVLISQFFVPHYFTTHNLELEKQTVNESSLLLDNFAEKKINYIIFREMLVFKEKFYFG